MKKTETENEIIYTGDLILSEDFKTEKKLIVHGNIAGKDGKRYNIKANDIHAHNIDAYNIDAHDIDAGNIHAHDIDAYNIHAYNIDAHDIDAHDIDANDIDAYDINAHNIDAYNIVCIKRIKRSKDSKTIAYSLTQDRFNQERKEQM